jgi:NAD(P)-dependent dehydrogenase (short-subunit alcohol dehydrogenase family)
MATTAGPAGLVAVVTGASRGLGRGMAEALAADGVRLGLCARTSPAAPAGTESVTGVVDVTDATAVDRFGAEVVETFGRIDLWINNAGLLAPIGPLADADPVAFGANIEVNVLGVAHGSATFARHVRSRPGPGVLVNISSGAATHATEGWAAYCGAKAAVEMITEVLAAEERSSGLVAYTLSPGLVDTDMQSLIRSTPAADFPAVEQFREAHRTGAFNQPVWVARYLLDELVLPALTGPGGPTGTSHRVPHGYGPGRPTGEDRVRPTSEGGR